MKKTRQNNYYPFGLRHKGYNELATENPSGFKYKFGGKELNDELGFEVYDFGARNYDPALGRWMNIDPLAEEMRRFSPYNYAFNNSVFFIDPDGMAPFGFDKNKLDELEPIVDINEMLAYEPTVMGMGLEDPTDPPGGGDDDKIYDNGELEELFIDRRNTMTKVGDAIKNQVWEMAYH
ncbi:RHS repeat domain-containing protein, partial [Avrilella dinanensis]|uniref:RHS repeat domain-containing protein n=1 Tax=Avrilella dinanensis TaxID=2008672 RepID=UPI002409E762